MLKEKRQAVISHAVTKGLKTDVPMKDSGIPGFGVVPAHWFAIKLRALAKIGNGSTPSRERFDYWGGGHYPWLSSTVVNQEEVTEADEFVTEIALTECHLPKIAPPAILIGITGQGRTRRMATTLRFEATINQHIAYIVPRSSGTDIEYLRLVFDMLYLSLRTDSEGGGSTKGAITCEQIQNLRIMMPPQREQATTASWIIEKKRALDSLVEQAKTVIGLLQERRSALISAAVTGKIDVRTYMAKPMMSVTPYTSGFAHQLLAAEILDRYNDQRMGRIKLQKLIHLCEYHGQVREIQGDYTRKAAGPFDAKAMAGIRSGLKKQKWFEEVREGERYVYRPLEKRGEHRKYLGHWQAEMPRIDEVLSLLGHFKTRECEIVSTLYAAWNDLLIDGGPVDDGTILHQASSAERWHKSKEQIASERWKKALLWMKDNGLIPIGFGKHTRSAAEQTEQDA